MESLWVAKTGLDAQQTRMTVVANNLANVNTNGFKRGRATFEDLLYQNVSVPPPRIRKARPVSVSAPACA